MLSEEQIGKLLSAQLFALMKDRRYGYASTPSFSNLNANGKQIMAELVEMLVPKVVEAIQADDKERAEQFFVDNLKK